MDIEISGGSDDLVNIDAVIPRNSDDPVFQLDGGDEFNCYKGGAIQINSSFTLIEPGGNGCVIHAIYDGCWSFAIGQLDSDKSIPKDWTITHGEEHSYSSLVTIKNVNAKAKLTRTDN